MNCRTARGLFSLHIDKCLSYEEERALIQHLEECTTCAAEYKGVERTVGWVRDLPEIPPSETFLQDVLLAAKETRQAAAVPLTAGWRERIREFFAGLSWASSPLVAPAALILGLGVGLGGTMVAFHGLGGGGSAGPSLADAPLAVEQVEPQPPSGPFEDLVQEMLRRAESERTEEEATESVPDLEWGPPLDVDIRGQQVGASPETWRNGDAKRRVTVAF
jgi:hypothetical protein